MRRSVPWLAVLPLLLVSWSPWVAAQTQRPEGLVLWWQFAEPGGLTAYDSSGQGNSGTLSAPVTRPADAATSWRTVQTQSGSYGPVTAANAPELNPGTGSWTFAYWYKNFNTAAACFSFGKSNYAGTDNHWYVYVNAGSDLYWAGSNIDVGPCCASCWKHLAVVRSGSSAITTYANGAQVTTGTDARTLSNSLNLTLGAPTDVSALCDARFRDVRIYNRALSAPEVLQVYREGLLAPRANRSVLDLAAALVLQNKGSFFQFFQPQ